MKDLIEMRKEWTIRSFDNICYSLKDVPGHLNLLDERDILKPSEDPILDDNIKYLIENVCGYKQENIDYLHRAILYKHDNIDDFTLPCIVLYGKGGSGKGTLMSLLATIFGESNVLTNLGQRELQSSFDTYKGQKLVVEFAEVTSNNTNIDKAILNRLKNIVGAQKLTVNEKNVKPYQIENSAWFFVSSNSNSPLKLDDKEKGNRRFSIIKSNFSLENGEIINKKVKDRETVRNYLAWLYYSFPEVYEYKKLPALDNQDKRELEDRSQEEANTFWEWYLEKFPDNKGKKIRHTEINDLIPTFCDESGTDQWEFQKYFWRNSRYQKTKMRLGKETFYGVEIL
ncbi:hypothetical protein AUK10_04115 [Candidatus Gracilibacteria bacterium CG2_30_37_12]|nr:MAG: hypothetical protein AUK10_04115 [Candidatus Gracilibacteria bacterium CG2_30_37_12]